MKSIPAVPATLAISCGSAITVVTPCCKTSLPNSAGVKRELSMCTCESISPGITRAPSRSKTRCPESDPGFPTALILPFSTEKEEGIHVQDTGL